MIMNDDYHKLCIEKIKNINYLNEFLDKKSIIIPNNVFCSIFIIDNNTYNKKLANPIDIESIKMYIDLDEIELDHENLIHLLDIAVLNRIPKELNEIIVKKCFDYYNLALNHEEKELDINNINKVLESIK